MSTKPILSVGIPTFNRPEALKQVLESVTKQTYQNLEVIVSDNGSEDPAVDILAKEFEKRDSRIKYFSQSENKGALFNFKFLLEHASGDYFMWLADDDELGDEDYFLALMTEIEKGYDFVFSNVRKTNLAKGRDLENKPVKFTSTSEKWFRHLEVIRKMYIGYQVVGGIYKTELIRTNVAIWFNSYYYDDVNDEESFFHFMLSRYNWSYVKDVYYVKDMTGGTMQKLSFWQILGPNFWNFVAGSGVIAQTKYKSSQKIQLIFWKLLRNLYIQYKMLVK